MRKSSFLILLGIISTSAIAKASVWDWSAALRAGVGYDSSLYRVDVGNLGDRSSFFLNLIPEIGLQWEDKVRLTYTANGHLYSSESEEDNIRHTLLLGLRNIPGLRLETAQTYVQGSRDAVIYDEGRNAFAAVAPRERRSQWQNRTAFSYTLGEERYFARWDAHLLYYNLHTIRKPDVPGYQNWVNRYDFNTGPDAGMRWQDHEIYLGYRRGHQNQGRQGGQTTDRSNDYNRFLVGWKGEVIPSVSLDGSVGFTHIRYTDSQSIGPSEKTIPYLDAGIRMSITEKDQVRISGSVRNWVGSTGWVSSVYQQYQGRYIRHWSDVLRTELVLGAFGLTYDGIPRDDWMFFLETNFFLTSWQDWEWSLRFRQEEGRDLDHTGQCSRDFSRSVGGIFLSRLF